MPAVICLAGPASPEKARFLSRLAAEFSARGLALGMISDPAPAASWPEAVAPAGVLHLRWPTDPAAQAIATLDELLARHFHAADLVLSEVQGPGRVKVEVVPAGGRPALLADPGLKALVRPEPRQNPGDCPAPCFGPDQAEALAEHLLARVLPPLTSAEAAPRPRLRILADGQRLPANHFVQEIVSGGIRAMIGSLKGGERAGRLEIHLY